MVDASRFRALNRAPVREHGDFVLYWMIAQRRPSWNFSLDRALEWCRELGCPLLVFEPLRLGYRWANERIHGFIIDGMRDNQAAFAESGVFYYPYLEPRCGEGQGLLQALAERASVVVTDDFPCFFLPRMVEAAAAKLDVKLEAVDANGLYPMHHAPKTFSRAVDFRRHLQKHLGPFLHQFPQSRPLEQPYPRPCPEPSQTLQRWPRAELEQVKLSEFDLDHEVRVTSIRGGHRAARQRLLEWLKTGFPHYLDNRNKPQESVTSGFSPFLHFGHLSSHEVFSALAGREGWKPNKLGLKARGQREGWWGFSPEGEAFLDQLVTWRELGYNLCCRESDYESWESLPQWAQTTLNEHADDPREYEYDLDTFERGLTHEPLWNAAQNQLRREGFIHNYLRMLWGKKILHWTRDPRQALDIAIHLNNKYGLDGRNPNSYSGVYWIFGRFDRAWGPEREIFGKVRYMTCASTRRKYKTEEYVQHFTQR